MIERDKIKWIKDENPEETGTYGQIYYKGVRLDLSIEIIQEIGTGYVSEKTVEGFILESYERCLRPHREQLLKDLLNDD